MIRMHAEMTEDEKEINREQESPRPLVTRKGVDNHYINAKGKLPKVLERGKHQYLK